MAPCSLAEIAVLLPPSPHEPDDFEIGLESTPPPIDVCVVISVCTPDRRISREPSLNRNQDSAADGLGRGAPADVYAHHILGQRSQLGHHTGAESPFHGAISWRWWRTSMCKGGALARPAEHLSHHHGSVTAHPCHRRPSPVAHSVIAEALLAHAGVPCARTADGLHRPRADRTNSWPFRSILLRRPWVGGRS